MDYLPRRPTYRPSPTPPSLALSHLVSQRASKKWAGWFEKKKRKNPSMWEVWPYKVFFSCPPTTKERPISLLGEMWMKKRICELKGDERLTTFVKLCGWRRKKKGVFWKPGENLNSNCNLPFKRGEIFFTTNYLPKSLSHRLRSAPSLYIWRSKSRMNAGKDRRRLLSWTVWCSATCWSDLFTTMLHLSAHVII